MGYYTRHQLEIIEGDDYGDHKEAISQLAGYSDCFGDEVKWYSHVADMEEYSKKYPNMVFKLSGEGEESGDIWVEYYKNGLMQRSKAVIKLEGYDEKKLVKP